MSGIIRHPPIRLPNGTRIIPISYPSEFIWRLSRGAKK